MVKMTDVAAAAGVSSTTVSHVLNATRPVSEALRAKVFQAVADTGYTPNSVARALATQNTMLIGIVMSFLSNPFFAPLVSDIDKTARRRGYTLLLTENHENTVDESKQVKVMLDRRVDGVILAPAARDLEPVLDILANSGTPTVLIDRFGDRRFDEVGVENIEPTAQLVAHLVEHGHDRIGFISGHTGLSTTVERLEGYRLGIERAGLSFDRKLVRSGGSQIDPARRAVSALLATSRPPTAIITANNAMTIGALRGLRDLGRRVPDDVALAAFDDFEWADLMSPALTTIAQPIPEMGRLATKQLLRRIGGYTGETERHALPPTFHRRRSCGCSETRAQ
ncbi:LacI family DNA-binding transcriptional regulator [Leekyejoonella antrihumi]|uniref:LacI family transcriptional regulator n=1 Tax=Leekyejoonella antrihumi TaxID=1660198 RepID=A0A563E0K7_9MICO|nr:LacI family DNA-binding transcriptional regulator [Leekyejoonella antrihumi]TWP35424.1 LacI family transcriptional regulator [Leekyejoonella antrihumi]